jgi:hypothetical protein
MRTINTVPKKILIVIRHKEKKYASSKDESSNFGEAQRSLSS